MIAELITFVFVSDLRRSHGFYSGALGLELVVDQGDCRIYAISTSAFVGICERPDQVSAPGMILTLVVDDVSPPRSRGVSGGTMMCRLPYRRAPRRNPSLPIRSYAQLVTTAGR